MKYFRPLAFILVLFLASCDSYKEIPYFQDLDRSSVVQQNIKNFSPYTIQPNDIVGVYVNSAASSESAKAFDPSLNRVNGNMMDVQNTNPIVGYLVDEKGNIQLPLVGTMKVAGYTVTDLKEQLLKSIATYIKDPTVNVRILNFKISILGDVQKPDIYPFPTDLVTIPQALSMAGDLNITAKRTSVLLIREVEGKRIFVPIDMTSKKLFDSPYYYLKNNDILYVDPNKSKFATVDRGYRNASIFIGIASVLTVIASIYFYNRK